MIAVGLCILIVGALTLALWRRRSDARRLAMRRDLNRSLINRSFIR